MEYATLRDLIENVNDDKVLSIILNLEIAVPKYVLKQDIFGFVMYKLKQYRSVSGINYDRQVY
jgi:hypothetical protein